MTRPTHLIRIAAGLGLLAGWCGAQETAHALPGHRLIETRANTFESNRQQDQTLAVAPDGRMLVAWGSRRQEFGTYGVFAQLVDPLGRPLGTEIHVNEYLPDGQVRPAAVFAPDGSAWVAWCSIGQDGSRGGIVLRRLAGTGADGQGAFGPAGPEVQVNQTVLGDQLDPAIAVNGDGRLMVVWVSEQSAAPLAFGRVFDASGQPLGGEFRLGEAANGADAMPNVAALAEGFATAWARTGADGLPAGIHGRIFSADGAPQAAELEMTPRDGRQHVEPSLDGNRRDRLALAWMASAGGAEWEVCSRLFDATGAALAPAAELAGLEAGARNGATVAMAPDGRYLVAYNVNSGKDEAPAVQRPARQVDVFAQLYSAAGEPVGGRWRFQDENDGEQTLQVGLNARRAVWSELDQIALAWHGTVCGDERGIGLTLYAPASLAIPAPPAVAPLAACLDLTRADLDAQVAPPDKLANWEDESHLPNPRASGPDFGFTAFSVTGWDPPDPDLAVGGSYIVAVVNVDMKVFDKNGTELYSTALEPFFNTGGFVFDPVALYDAGADRYVVAAVEHLGNTDRYHIAVSQSNNPSSGLFYKYVFDVNSICDFIDFPNLGMGSDAYYVVADCFGTGRNYIHVMPKAPMLSGGAATKTSVLNESGIVSTGATKNYDSGGVGYFVSSYARGTPYLRLYAVQNSSSPTKSSYDLNVGGFSSPPDAQQLGSSNLIDTIDHRIKNGVVRNGILWCCHSVNGGDGAAKVRWYKIDLRGWPTSGQTPVLLDSGSVNEGSNIDAWFGDINADAQGNMAVAFNRSSPNERVGVYRTFRVTTDPAGTVRAGTEMQTSTGTVSSSRWGDYSGLEEDPVQPSSFWSHHEYQTTSWRTWVGHFPIDTGVQLASSPLVRGTTASLTVTNAINGETVWFLYSLSGSTVNGGPCPAQLGGLCLDILNPVTIVGSATVSSGSAVLLAPIPPGAPLVPVWLQAAIQRGVGNVDSVETNVVATSIQ